MRCSVSATMTGRERKNRTPSRLRLSKPSPIEYPDADVYVVRAIATNSPPPRNARGVRSSRNHSSFKDRVFVPPENTPRRRRETHPLASPPPAPPPAPPPPLPPAPVSQDLSTQEEVKRATPTSKRRRVEVYDNEDDDDDDFQEPTPKKVTKRSVQQSPSKRPASGNRRPQQRPPDRRRRKPSIVVVPRKRLSSGRGSLNNPLHVGCSSRDEVQHTQPVPRRRTVRRTQKQESIRPQDTRRTSLGAKSQRARPSSNFRQTTIPRNNDSGPSNRSRRHQSSRHMPQNDNGGPSNSSRRNPSNRRTSGTSSRRKAPTPPDDNDESSSEDSDDFEDFDFAENEPDTKFKWSQILRSSTQEAEAAKKRVDKALFKAIEMDRSQLTEIQINVLRVLWNRRPRPGKSENVKNFRKRGGWMKIQGIVDNLKQHDPREVRRTIRYLVKNRILETSEDRMNQNLRTLGAQLLFLLLLPDLKKASRMVPSWQSKKKEPKRKKEFIGHIRRALRRPGQQQVVVPESDALGVGMANHSRIARAIVEMSGHCVRIRKLVSKKIEMLNDTESTDEED